MDWVGIVVGALAGFIAGSTSGWLLQRSGRIREARAHIYLDTLPTFERETSLDRNACDVNSEPQTGDRARALFPELNREAIATSAIDGRKVNAFGVMLRTLQLINEEFAAQRTNDNQADKMSFVRYAAKQGPHWDELASQVAKYRQFLERRLRGRLHRDQTPDPLPDWWTQPKPRQ